MSQHPAPPPDQHPGVSGYVLICIGALALMAVALVLRRADAWALFPVLVGGLALILRWRAGPLMVLLAVVLLLWSWWLGTDPGWLGLTAVNWVRRWLLSGWWAYIRLPRRGLPSRQVLPLSDWLLAVSLVSYAAGQYRLQGLLERVFPPDPRTKRQAAAVDPGPGKPAATPPRRAPESVTTREFVVLLLALPACCGVASLFWVWLRRQETDLPMADSAWQGLLILWLLGGGVLAAAGLLRYLTLRHWTRTEAAMYLQDVLWKETRREQRRLNRWLAWAWLRRQRREARRPS